MVEIGSAIFTYLKISFRKILPLAALFFSFASAAQDLPQSKPGKMMIEVLHADDLYDQVESRTGRRLARLLGNVSFRHKEVYML